jgi:hypothetical protein
MTAQEKAQELVDKYSMITKWKMGVEQEYVIKKAKELIQQLIEKKLITRVEGLIF